MKLNYSQKILILSLLVLIGVVVLDVIFTNLLVGRILGINEKVKQLTISSRERERSFILQDLINNSKQERSKLESHFVGPGDAKTADFIGSIERLAKVHSVVLTIKSVNYESIPEMASSDVVSLIKFKANIVGRWDGVLAFVRNVEALPNVSQLTQVSLEAVLDQTKSQARNWSANVDFSVVKLKK